MHRQYRVSLSIIIIIIIIPCGLVQSTGIWENPIGPSSEEFYSDHISRRTLWNVDILLPHYTLCMPGDGSSRRYENPLLFVQLLTYKTIFEVQSTALFWVIMQRLAVIIYPKNNYCSLRNNPEEYSSHQLRRESLQSRIFSVQFVGNCYERDLPPLQNSLAHVELLVSYCYYTKYRGSLNWRGTGVFSTS